MYKTKKWLILLIVIAVITILTVIFGVLIYVEATTSNRIFGFSSSENQQYKIASIIMFAVSGGLFIIELFVFIFYLIYISHNNQTLKIIRKLKQKFMDSQGVSSQEVDDALIQFQEEVDEAKKRGIDLVAEKRKEDKANIFNKEETVIINQPITSTTNLNQTYNQNNNLKTTTTTTTITRTNNVQQRPLPPPPANYGPVNPYNQNR